METIAIACQKGGVGKTSTCLALGDGLARMGHKVLYVDLDAQMNLTYTLGGVGEAGNVLTALQQPKRAKGEVQLLGDNIGLLASIPSLAGADTFLVELGKEYRLKEALEAVAQDFDVCLVDTPPSLGILTVNALTASDALIAPTQADVFSLQGIRQLSGTIDGVRAYTNKNLFFMGLLVTRFNGRAVIRKDIAEMLEKTAHEMGTKVFNTKIRECVSIVEAQAMRQSIFTYAPRSNATKDYTALVDEVATSLRLG